MSDLACHLEWRADLAKVEAPLAFALAAFANDLELVCGRNLRRTNGPANGPLLVLQTGDPGSEWEWKFDPAAGQADTWHLLARTQESLAGAIWRLSDELLDVPPLTSFLGLPYPSGEWTPRPLCAPRYRVPLRGWFFNDEDHLTGWRGPSGKRPARYLFYDEVMNRSVSNLLMETALRTGLNLLIPSSFLDVEVELDAATVRDAAERGLWLTQHHIEPLGVSYHAFHAYHRTRGGARFSYHSHPDAFDEVWRHYVRRWLELTGGRVVWQLGLRADRDAPLHKADPDAPSGPEAAAELTARVVEHQLRILREETGEQEPKAAFTLWADNIPLFRTGRLRLPDWVTLIFSNNTSRGELPSWVSELKGRRTGFYHHCGWYYGGPHEVQGRSPEHIAGLIDAAETQAGPLELAISNVQNLRELVVSADAFAAFTRCAPENGGREFLREWDARYFGSGSLAEVHTDFFRTFVPRADDPAELWLDGYLREWGLMLLDRIIKDQVFIGGEPRLGRLEIHAASLARSVEYWSVLARRADLEVARLASPERTNAAAACLVLQARWMLWFSRWALEVNHAASAVLEGRDVDAATALEKALVSLRELEMERARHAAGHFQGWYDNDGKFDLRFMIALTMQAWDLLILPRAERGYEPWEQAQHFDFINAYAVRNLAS